MLLIGVDTDQHYCDSPVRRSVADERAEDLPPDGLPRDGRDRSSAGSSAADDEGTLANGGVGLAPYYGLGKHVPARLRRELEKLEKGIVDGSISLDPKSYV